MLFRIQIVHSCMIICEIVTQNMLCFYITALMKFLPDRCTALAKKELLYAGTFGVAAWLSGLIFVDRVNRDKARQTMGDTARLMHERNVSRNATFLLSFKIPTFSDFNSKLNVYLTTFTF